MTYKYLAHRILDYAINKPYINYAMEGNISEINNQTVLQYPLFMVSPTGMHTERENTITYALTFYYFDRMLADESNATDVYSVGIQALQSIARSLEMDDEIISIDGDVTYQFYRATDGKVLNDTCAGVFSSIRITVPKEVSCP